MAKFSNFKESKTKQEEQQTPQYVTVHCCAPGCGFTETVNASDPRPFTCKYHQQADRRFGQTLQKTFGNLFRSTKWDSSSRLIASSTDS